MERIILQLKKNLTEAEETNLGLLTENKSLIDLIVLEPDEDVFSENGTSRKSTFRFFQIFDSDFPEYDFQRKFWRFNSHSAEYAKFGCRACFFGERFHEFRKLSENLIGPNLTFRNLKIS